jgi:hypothetical protein
MTPSERELVIYIRRQAKSALKLADMLLEADDKERRKVAVKTRKVKTKGARLTQSD